uniref:Carboxylic ester hydrolase n=2 Tax=Lepeophtheirus salmonis TaxID=72036 RepID=A0A7R8XPS8_LEPSM|nr:Glutactin-like [Lepeophtheirus salmonis salmonis]
MEIRSPIIWISVMALVFLEVHSWKRDEPETSILKLPKPYGFLKGKLRKTFGNEKGETKMYKVFRNIPYAEPMTKERRFSQSQAYSDERDILGPTKSNPYDATKSGPVCAQGEINPDNITTYLDMNNLDLIELLMENTRSREEINNKFILKMAGKLFDLEGLPLETMTLSETIKSWLDVDFGMSEDCLHLTISTPVKPPPKESKGYPVMFFVHGGGFSSGTHLHSEADRLGDAADVIVVAINYRVGILGFLCLDSDESAGNQGMLDILLALEWVQKYIEHFGGDKERVTIFGESAGSATIGHLLLSPSTREKNLFKYGIGQSGSAISPWAFDREPRRSGYEFAERLGCKTINENEDDDSIVKCLRNFEDWEITKEFSLFTTERRKHFDLGFGGSSPCAQTKGDKKFYGPKDDPMEILYSGDYNTEVPIFFGNNLYEGIYTYNLIYNTVLKPNNYVENNNRTANYLKYQMIEDLNRALGFKNGYTVEKIIKDNYFGKDNEMKTLKSVVPGLIDYLGTQILKASSYYMMSKHASHTGNAYWYSFEYNGTKSICHTVSILTEGPFVGKYGACHADELMFMFDYELPLVLCDIQEIINVAVEYVGICTFEIECVVEKLRESHSECIDGYLTDEEKKVASTITKAWTNFAYYGNPNGNGLPILKSWTKENPEYIVYNKENRIDIDYKKKYILNRDVSHA